MKTNTYTPRLRFRVLATDEQLDVECWTERIQDAVRVGAGLKARGFEVQIDRTTIPKTPQGT